MNASKAQERRFWKRWYASGAVRQPAFPNLIIDDVATHFAGPAKGCQTLSLGMRVVESGPGWTVEEPTTFVVVPAQKKFAPGVVLERIPANAVPVNLFFPE